MNYELFNNIKDAINKSEYIYVHEDITFVWNGSNTINVYNIQFINTDCFTCFKELNIKKVQELIDDYIEEL